MKMIGMRIDLTLMAWLCVVSVYSAAASGSLIKTTGWIPACLAACSLSKMLALRQNVAPMTKYRAFLQSQRFRLVRPDSGDAQNEIFLAEFHIVPETGIFDDRKSVLVNGANEVGGDVDGSFREYVRIFLEAGRWEIGRSVLIRVKQQLDSANGRVAPVDLATPLELGGIRLVVHDQGGDLGLAVALKTCQVTVNTAFQRPPKGYPQS